MSDPLSQIIGLLRPDATLSKLVTAAGQWAVQPPVGGPFYGALLEGRCFLSMPGRAALLLNGGDFFLLPAAGRFTVSSSPPPLPHGVLVEPVQLEPGIIHIGTPGAQALRMLVGHYRFASEDAELLVSLLPELVVVRDQHRLPALVTLLDEETRADRPGRDAVLSRLLEVLLIEALRTTTDPAAAPGLLRGLADQRLAPALRAMHAEPDRAWTVAALAGLCASSRSSFADRFRRAIGVSPMDYLLGWRMALAKTMLRNDKDALGAIAEQVGYASQSAFSVAFTRQTGVSPMRYARSARDPVRRAATETA